MTEGNGGPEFPGLEGIQPFDAESAMRGDHDNELAQRQDIDEAGQGVNPLVGTPQQEAANQQPLEFFRTTPREELPTPQNVTNEQLQSGGPPLEHFRLRSGEQPGDAEAYQHYRLDADEAAIERARQASGANDLQHYRLKPGEVDDLRIVEAERIANLVAPNVPPNLRTPDVPQEPEGIDVLFKPEPKDPKG